MESTDDTGERTPVAFNDNEVNIVCALYEQAGLLLVIE